MDNILSLYTVSNGNPKCYLHKLVPGAAITMHFRMGAGYWLRCKEPKQCHVFSLVNEDGGAMYMTVTSNNPISGAFDLLVYTDKDLMVPEKWEESGPQIIDQSEEVRLRSFTTSIHKVNSMVAYKRTDSA